jgi:hypothetical protein
VADKAVPGGDRRNLDEVEVELRIADNLAKQLDRRRVAFIDVEGARKVTETDEIGVARQAEAGVRRSDDAQVADVVVGDAAGRQVELRAEDQRVQVARPVAEDDRAEVSPAATFEKLSPRNSRWLKLPPVVLAPQVTFDDAKPVVTAVAVLSNGVRLPSTATTLPVSTGFWKLPLTVPENGPPALAADTTPRERTAATPITAARDAKLFMTAPRLQALARRNGVPRPVVVLLTSSKAL